MLTREERSLVEAAFAQALAGENNQKGLVKQIFPNQGDTILLAIPAQFDSNPQTAMNIVSYCLNSRWTENPALLDLLLKYLIELKGNGQFQNILLRVRDQVDPNASLYDTVWLDPERPFFDRVDLRARVKRLVEENTRPILKVTAPPDAFGRSYSQEYLVHLEDKLPGVVHIVAVSLSPGTGPTYDILDFAGTVGAQLLADEPIPDRTSSSYPRTIATWLLKFAMRKSERWLIVLDGFGQKPLNEEVRQTIEAMAEVIPTGQFRQRVRLVLLDYPDTLPNVNLTNILEEVLRPADLLSQADLEPCILQWATERSAAGKEAPSAGRILALAQEMLDTTTDTGKKRLEALNGKLAKLREMA
jgi:hypothetical protein